MSPALLLLNLPRPLKKAFVMAVDAALCVFTVWLAYLLRLGELSAVYPGQGKVTLAALLLAMPIFHFRGLYRVVFRHSGGIAQLLVAVAVAAYGVCFGVLIAAVAWPLVPRTVGVLQPLLLLLGMVMARVFARYLLGRADLATLPPESRQRVLIYGAGAAGRQLASGLVNNRHMQVVGFLDDDPSLQGRVLNGHAIHDPRELPYWVRSLEVHTVLLAIPSVSREQRNRILERAREAHVSVRTLPSLADLQDSQVQPSDLRELDFEDLLGRDAVSPNTLLLSRNIRGKVVLVTGAGGSIGSELCRQILRVGPAQLLMLDISEFALYTAHQDLLRLQASAGPVLLPSGPVVPLIGSVCDEARLREIMLTWRPHTVYHAAAYKHVPLVEHNPAEGVRNNVLGTRTTALVAQETGVRDFVLVSTDKAVRPTNIMGASKRLAEMILQALAAMPARGTAPPTRFSMVRFGNVLGSSGSVVPLFRRQIAEGGPVTLTHPDVTRYFMTIPEAALLVIQAGAMADGGDVFVLDMGQPVRIQDLARRTIELSGLTVKDADNPDGDIAIRVTGLRPGEKLFEELLIGDNAQPTQHPRILKASEEFLAWPMLEQRLRVLSEAVAVNDVPGMRRLLQDLVVGYRPGEAVVDWVYLAQGDGESIRDIRVKGMA